jgi:hypothetical protein
MGDEDPIGQISQRRHESAFRAGSIDAVGMQAIIDLARSDRSG